MKLYEKIYISLAFFLGITEIIILSQAAGEYSYNPLVISPGLNLLCLAGILLIKKGISNLAGFVSFPLMFFATILIRAEFGVLLYNEPKINDLTIIGLAFYNLPLLFIIVPIFVFLAIRPYIAKKVA